MTARAELPLAPPVSAPPAPPPARRALPPLWALLVAVVLSPLALLMTVLAGSDNIALGGDQAVIELATREAADGNRTLGPYSRYGWSHPGPLWYYLLAVPYRLLGSSSAALYVGVLLLHLVVGALVVLAADRWLGRLGAVAAASAVVLTEFVLGAEVFRTIWNPYALLLPTVLFLLLAAVAAGGSAVGLAGAALVATFLVQTHVSAAVPVGAVALVSALAFFAVRGRAARPLPPRRELAVAGVLLLTTALVWLPPVVQEVRPGMGNAAQMRFYAGIERPGQTWEQAVATVGSELLVLPTLGRAPQPPEATANLDPSETAAVAAFAVASLGLVAVGVRRRRARATALAGLSLVCMAASIAAVTQVDAPVYPYLVVWQSVLPLTLLLAATALLSPKRQRQADQDEQAAGQGPAARRAPLVGAAVVVAAAAAVASSVAAPLVPDEKRYSVADAVAAVSPFLPEPGEGPVRVRIGTSGAWPMAAGVVLALDRRGYDVRVTKDWIFMFGGDLASTDSEPTEVLLIQHPQLDDLPPLPDAAEVGLVQGPEGLVHLLVRRGAAGAPVPPVAGPVTGKFLPA